MDTMMTYCEPAREIPVAAEVDVLVIGGGPAGVGAALAAARNGANTLLVERSSSLGGMWTLAMQVHATSFHDHNGRVIVGGIALEIIQRLHAAGAAQDPVAKAQAEPSCWWVAFDPDLMRCELDQMMRQAGARVLLHSVCVGTIVEQGRVGGAIVETVSGRLALRAKVTIDCSGNGDVFHHAGARYDQGRPLDGANQPGTTTFMMDGVDWQRAREWATHNEAENLRRQDVARKAGRLSVPHRLAIGAPGLLPGTTYHNVTRVRLDPTDAWSLSEAEMDARRQVRDAVEYYRANVPGFENAQLRVIAAQLGLRESRRLAGRYCLTADDVLHARKFPDAVARHNYYIDVHDGTGTRDDRNGADLKPAAGEYYEIPYRCLLPQTVEQLLVAGRCISASREGLGSARTTVCCCELGQAAGTAAAMAVQRNAVVSEINGEELSRKVLAL